MEEDTHTGLQSGNHTGDEDLVDGIEANTNAADCDDRQGISQTRNQQSPVQEAK
jgi:hypothetical protein